MGTYANILKTGKTKSGIVALKCKIACVSLSLILMSCAFNKATPFEKSLYVCMVVSTATDMITTDKVLDQGGYELNPMLGRHPNNETLWMYGVGKVALHTVTPALLPDKWAEFYRKYVWGLSCASSTVLTIHNYGEIK